jgi:hypothetical protein
MSDPWPPPEHAFNPGDDRGRWYDETPIGRPWISDRVRQGRRRNCNVLVLLGVLVSDDS